VCVVYWLLADTRQSQWVSVLADTYLSIGTDTSSPVIRLPVSTVNTVAYSCTVPIVSSLYRTKKIMHVVAPPTNHFCTVS